MTPRERIVASLEHRRPDRVPLTAWIRPEVDRALAAHFGCSVGEAHQRLGIEGWGAASVEIQFPGWRERAVDRLPGDFPYANRPVVLHDADTFEDEWGVWQRVGRDRRYVEWVSGPWQDLDDPAAAVFPGVDRLRVPADLAQRVAAQQAAEKFVVGGFGAAFKYVWHLRGLEQTLMDYVANRPFLEAVYDQVYGLLTAMACHLASAGVDMISIVGDISMQDRLMMSPRGWREIDKPRLRYLIGQARRIKPDLHWFIHSDGNYESILPDLLELGFDVLNPIQPECMDPFRLKQQYGRQVTLHGTGSIQRTLPLGTPEDCRREVLDRLRFLAWNGGLVLMPSNVIQADTPLENVLAWFETARDYDLSQLPDEEPDWSAAPPAVRV
ncbi:MAG: hypothetical protein IT204_07440 [Fimbriimonadaceae bacterium]|nr:hypothetical protein [Fimbriimonadaceae bacterium]